MRILHVIRGLANVSGTTHIVVPLTEELARLGCRVHVFHVEKRQGKRVEPDPSLVRSACFRMSLPGSSLGYSADYARALARCIGRFDLVHIHAIWNFPTWHAMKVASRAGVPYIVSPQGSLEEWALGHNRARKLIWMRCIEGPWFHRAAAFQALTAAEESQVRNQGIRTPVVRIPNGIRLQDFPDETGDRQSPERYGLPESARVILFLGRIHEKKGLDRLVRAMPMVLQSVPEAVCLIAGHDGGLGYRDQIERLVHDLGLDDHVRFVGEVRGEAKMAALRSADVFALPSHSEGLPIAVLEAMASRLPVVISPGCNIPEVSEAGAGLVVEPDPEKISAAIVRILTNPETAGEMGHNGRSLIEGRFNWERIAEETLKAYERILEGGGRHG